MNPTDPVLTPDERARLEWIRDWRKPQTGNSQAVQLTGGSVGRPDWQLKDVRVGPSCFFNFTAKVSLQNLAKFRKALMTRSSKSSIIKILEVITVG
jgi:hypothetical protein